MEKLKMNYDSLVSKCNYYVQLLNLKDDNQEKIWLVSGFIAKYFFRLTSTIVLSRIYAPDIFGIMAIMFTIITCLTMISDIGIRSSIIQNSIDHTFLKTAWTLQLIRNIIICCVIILISPQLAIIYSVPELANYMPVLSLSILIQGFCSTNVALYFKMVKVKEISIMEIVTQAFCLIVTIILAYILSNIWAFILGIILTELLKTFYSFYYFKGGVVGILLNKTFSNQIIKFGKWIFFATLFTYIVGEGNKLIFGLFLTNSELGIYHIASMTALVPIAFLREFNSKITLPKLTRVANADINKIVSEFEFRQKNTLLLFLPFTYILLITGRFIISTIYSQEYAAAGDVFTIIMMSVCFNVIFFSMSPIFLSLGNSFYHMLNQKIYGLTSILLATSGYYYDGYLGLLYGLVVASFFQSFLTLLLVNKILRFNHNNTYYAQMITTFIVIVVNL
jgi:O-antigen/teichoic acid export membrane protein